MLFHNIHLCVRRGGVAGLAHPTLVHSELNSSDLQENQIILRVETFGFSANNITYGLLGEHPHFRYFDFFPAPKTSSTSPETHGVIPVWGFGTVVAARHSAVKIGQRLYGYYAMAKYVVLQLERQTNKYHANVSLGSFGKDRRPYKQMTFCETDPMYQKDREDDIMLYRPLFWTSYWFEDWLNVNNYFTTKTVVVSSASSKTAFTVAYNIQRRKQQSRSPAVRVVGLTSQSNLRFTRNLGLYDDIFTYADLASVASTNPSSQPLIYVDVLGNPPLNSRVNEVLSPSVFVSLGMSNPTDGATASVISKGDKSKTSVKSFFMPEWLAVRIKQLSPQQIVKLQVEAWVALMRDCVKWVNIEKIYGTEESGVILSYRKTLEGMVGADKGQAFSLWGEGSGGADPTAESGKL